MRVVLSLRLGTGSRRACSGGLPPFTSFYAAGARSWFIDIAHAAPYKERTGDSGRGARS